MGKKSLNINTLVKHFPIEMGKNNLKILPSNLDHAL